MNVIEIRNIKRKDIPLHYREEFAGLAILDNPRLHRTEDNIEFSLERTPFGTKEVEVRFSVTPDYPAIPAIRILKEFILKLEREGKLN